MRFQGVFREFSGSPEKRPGGRAAVFREHTSLCLLPEMQAVNTVHSDFRNMCEAPWTDPTRKMACRDITKAEILFPEITLNHLP
jgi:hypothetical protein